MAGDIFPAVVGVEDTSIHGEIDARRQRLHRCDGGAKIKFGIGHVQPRWLHRTRQHDGLARNRLQGQRVWILI
jgi:hypothetical protein